MEPQVKINKQQPIPKQKDDLYIEKQDFQMFMFEPSQISQQLMNSLTKKLPKKKYYQVEALLKNSIQTQDDMIRNAKVCHIIVQIILSQGLGEIILSAYFKFLAKRQTSLQQFYNKKQIIAFQYKIPQYILPYYIEAFKLDILNPKELNQLGLWLIDNKYQNQALHLADYTHSISLFRKIYKKFPKMKKNVVRSIKKHNFDKKQYSDIIQDALGSSVRYWTKQGVQYLEELYGQHQSIMARGLQDTLKKQTNEVLSICRRNPNLLKYFPKYVSQDVSKMKFIIPNPLRTDKFAPSNPQIHIKLSDFGIKQTDVLFVDSNHPQLGKIVQQLRKCNNIGIDTQSRISLTAFDEPDQLIETIQLAPNNNKIYILDAQDKNLMSNQMLQKWFTDFINDEKNSFIGHTVFQDIREFYKSILPRRKGHLKDPNDLKCRVIDVSKIFREEEKSKKYSLAFICQNVFEKELCKKYTISNWNRRPLLKNQLHYAALDAFIVVKIYEQFLKKYQKLQ